MSERDDTVLERVALETKASSEAEANLKDSDERPPIPPKRSYSLEKTEEPYARVNKPKTIGSYIRPQFTIYKQKTDISESWMPCLKISLIVFNLIIWALGAGITALGIWIQTDGDFSKIQENLDVNQFTTAGWILIFVGILVMLVGFIGCYGAICSSICFLIIFAIIGFVVIIMEIAVIAIVWTAVANKNTQEDMKLKAKRAMAEMMENDVKRSFIDLLQSKLHCCGVDGPDDYSIDPANPLPIPPSCTNQDTGVPYQKGCFQTLIDYFKSKASIVGGVAVAVFLLQLGALVLTICLLCGLKQAATGII